MTVSRSKARQLAKEALRRSDAAAGNRAAAKADRAKAVIKDKKIDDESPANAVTRVLKLIARLRRNQPLNPDTNALCDWAERVITTKQKNGTEDSGSP